MTGWLDAVGALELRDSSGPVSPRHQLERELDVEVTSDSALVRRRVRRRGGLVEQTEDRLDADGRRTLLEALRDAGLASLPDRALSTDERARVGVAFNHLTWALGDSSGRVEYLSGYLARSEARALRDVIDALMRV